MCATTGSVPGAGLLDLVGMSESDFGSELEGADRAFGAQNT